MLFYLACWDVLIAFGCLVGDAVLVIARIQSFPHRGDRLITATWLGLLIIASSLLCISTVFPLSSFVGLFFSLTLAVIALSIKAVRNDLRTLLGRPRRSVLLGFGIFATCAALNSTRPVSEFDTGLYHYQLTQWLGEFGTVPGLALIHLRFGSSSSWFALAAPFNSGPFHGRIAGLLGGLAIFISLLHFALALARILQHRENRADWFLAGGYPLIFLVCFFWSFEVSLSPDVPSWILTLLVAWLILLASNLAASTTSGPHSGHAHVLPLFMAFEAVTLKLVVAPLVAVAILFFCLNSLASWLKRFLILLLAGLVSVPFLVGNLVSSGCPVFPNPMFCLDQPWGVGKAAAQFWSANTMNYARWGGPVPAGAREWDWLLPWFSQADKWILVSFVAICLSGFFVVRGRWRGTPFAWVLGIALTGTAFSFFTAPNPRFAIGYLALYPALFLAAFGTEAVALVHSKLANRIQLTRVLPLGYLLLSLSLLLALQDGFNDFKLGREMHPSQNLLTRTGPNFVSRLLLPPALPQFSGDLMIIKNRKFSGTANLEIVAERVNEIEYHRPVQSELCWGVALPCMPSPLADDVHLRRPSRGLRSGFVRVTPLLAERPR